MSGHVRVDNNNCFACTQVNRDIVTAIEQATFYGGLVTVLLPGFPFTAIVAYAMYKNAGLIGRNLFSRECTHYIDARCQKRES